VYPFVAKHACDLKHLESLQLHAGKLQGWQSNVHACWYQEENFRCSYMTQVDGVAVGVITGVVAALGSRTMPRLYLQAKFDHPLRNRDDNEIKHGDFTAAGWYVKFIRGRSDVDLKG
jgi:hypothetical protein